MSSTFEKMMKEYLEMYMNSEFGQKTLLLSTLESLNTKSLDDLKELLGEQILKEWQYNDLKYIINKTDEIASLKIQTLQPQQIKVLCDLSIQVSNLLSELKHKKGSDDIIKKHIKKLYQAISVFNVKPRTLSLEEFLTLDVPVFEDENEEDNYIPPERAQESKLKKYGYSVAWDNPLSNKERQALLKDLIETGLVSKGYVISYLKHNIQINGKKKTNDIALSKWKDDLDFVYKL